MPIMWRSLHVLNALPFEKETSSAERKSLPTLSTAEDAARAWRRHSGASPVKVMRIMRFPQLGIRPVVHLVVLSPLRGGLVGDNGPELEGWLIVGVPLSGSLEAPYSDPGRWASSSNGCFELPATSRALLYRLGAANALSDAMIDMGLLTGCA